MRKGTKVYMIEQTVPADWLKRAKESHQAIINKFSKKVTK